MGRTTYFSTYGSERVGIVRDALDIEADRLCGHLAQALSPNSELSRTGVYDRAKALVEAHEMWLEARDAALAAADEEAGRAAAKP